MKSWELEDVFLLISNVFEENELSCLWQAEKNPVLDQLIVRRITPSRSPDVQIKHEQDLFDFDFDGRQVLEKHVREQDCFDSESNGDKEPEKDLKILGRL